MKRIIKIWACCMVGWLSIFHQTRLNAQPLPNEGQLFINRYSNEIVNKEQLSPMFRKLYLCNLPSCMLSVLHIGDSHVKSRFYSLGLQSQLNDLFNQLDHGYRINDSMAGRKTYFFDLQEYAVIGTRFENYCQSPVLANYLKANKPDLVIVSLGTNDAYSGISIAKMSGQMQQLIALIRTNDPGCHLIFTTPPDELKPIPMKDGADRMQHVRTQIIANCMADTLPYWNMYAVMGGTGQMRTWQRWGFATADNVHYTANGYTLFGRLFATAIFESFKRFLKI